MKTTKYILTLLLTVWCAVGNLYAITSSYYSTVDGKKESGLRDALYSITSVGPANGHSYNNLWAAYKTTDVYPTGDANAGKIWDMYSDCLFTAGTDQCGNYSNVCDCYNREHSLPKSWFSEANPAYYDMGHIVPTDGKVNGMRSNYAFGEVAAGAATWGNGKLGNAKTFTTTDVKGSSSITTTYTGTVFEPADKYKGDFARMYMYMVVRYKPGNSNNVNLAASGDGTKMFNSTDANYGITDYSIALLMKWHRSDPVSQKEIDRNNGMQNVQGNRNPFIDYPCLAEYLWGDKAGETVTLSELVGTFDGSWTTGDGCPCGTNPAIKLPNGAIDCGATSTNTAVTKTITVQGVNLSANLSLAVSGTNNSFFTLSANSIQKDVAIAGTTVTITYKPTSTGSHTATLTISGGGLSSSRTFALSGTCCNPYTVTLSRNNITETVSACGTYTLPTAEEESDACDGWEFQGWITGSTSFTENQTTAPSYTLSVSSTTTLYAVYAKEDANGAPHRIRTATTTWTKVTDASTLKSGDVLVIASNTSNATAGDISGDYMAKVSSTFSSDNSTITSLGSGTVELTLGGSAGAWTLSSTSGALGATAAKKVAWGSGTQTWSISISSGNAIITNGTSSYGKIQYNSGSPRFTTYTSNQAAVQLYRKSGGSSTTHYKKMPCTVRTISYAHTDGSTPGGTYWADVTSALPGTTITLDYDPAEGYALDSWTVTGGSVTVTNNQFTMPDANVTVSATFKTVPKRTIRFYNNGTLISTQSVYEGSTPNVPSVNGCDGYEFVGWWTSALAENNTTEQTWVSDFTVTQAQDYYAIFSHTVTGGSGGGGSVTKSMTSFDAISGNVDSDSNISYAAAQGTAGTAPAVNGGEIRIYQNGGTLTITANNSKKITSITIGSSMVTTVTYSVDGGTASSNQSISANGTTTVSNIQATSVLFTCTGTDKNHRLYLNNLSVTYSGGGSGSTTYYTSTTNCAAACTKLDAPSVTATPGNGQIALSWSAIDGATGYTVSISKGAGYTTECGSAVTSPVTVTGTSHTFTGLINGLEYTTSVIANASNSSCNSEADEDTAMPMDCTPWDDPTISWNYSLNTTDNKTATFSVSGTTHGTRSFESSNTDVLTVDNTTGAVTAVAPGSATITVHWTGASGYCEKSVISQTFAISGPLTITYNANYGETPATTTQTVTYNTAATLTANGFTRTGYTFMGWATAPDGEKVYDNSQTNVTFTNSQTLYAVWQVKNNNVTFDPSPIGATVKVNGSSTSPQSAEYGSTVTIAVTPAEHYTISSVTATGGSALTLTGTGDTRTFTMPDEAVTVAVSMTAETQYAATFMNNTTSFATANYYVDDDITAPADTPTSCDDDEFTFVGWVSVEQAEEATTHPEILTFPQTMPTGGVTYYALFRRSEGGGGGSGGEASVTFKTAGSDGTAAYTSDSDIKTNLVETYTGISSFEGNKLYKGASGMKLGSSKGNGYITLTLSSPITTNTITVEANKYGTDAGKIEVEVNGSTTFGEAQSPADGTLEFTGDDIEISSLTVSTTSQRAYITSISLGGGESGANYYTTAPECIPCENQVTITKGAETNGTFTLSLANGSYDNCKKNVSLTVSGITPATDYYCTGVTATGNSNIVSVVGPDGSGNYTVAYAKGYSVNSTVTAHFAPIPTYTVIWSIDGDESMTATYKEGEAITFPTSDQVEGCDGKVFRGWSATTVAETDDEPTYTTSATMGTEDVTYYAVFAEAETSGGGGSATWSKASSIAKGDKVIFVCEGVSKELSGFSSTSTVYGLGTAYNNEPAGTYVFDVDDGNSTGTFAFKNGNKYLCWTSGNSLNVNGTLNNNTSWSVSISNGNATVLNVADNTRQILWNVSSPRFATYSGQSVGNSYYAIQLYKQSTSGGTTTYSGYTTTCAPCLTKVTLTKGEESHGTFTLNKADGEHNNCASNFVVTVSGITPANGYYCTGVTATGGANVEVSGPDASGNYTVTYTKGNSITSTITANFAALPTYTVTWSINGDVSNTSSYREGQSIDFPTTAEGCDDMTFMGWSATSFGPTEDKPTYVTSAVMGTAALTYYAVFAEASTSVGEGSSDDYELFSGELTEGNYLIVYGGGAMKNSVSSDRLDYSEVTAENNVITTTDASIIWHIAPSGDYWTIYNASEEAYAAGTGVKNKAQMLASGTDDKALWSCSSSASSETYDFVNKANTSNGVNATLRKNSTYGFACYATGTGGALSLYKSAGSGTTYTYTTSCRACATPTISFETATVNKFDGDAPFTITPTVTGNTMGATLSYKSSNTDKAEVNADGTVTIKDAMSDQPITITATLARVETTEACQNRATASYTLNIYNKVTWSVNGTPCEGSTFTSQTTEGGEITAAPADPEGGDVCFGKAFVGWTTAEYEESDEAPAELYSADELVGKHITANTTYYAVFADLTGTINEYKKGTSAQLTTGAQVIIVNTAANKALKAETGSPINGTGITVSPDGTKFTSTETAILWTVQQSDDGGYYFMCGDKYLNASGSKLYCDGDEDAWKLTGAGPYVITSGKSSSYSLEYYSGTFKMYTTGSGDAFNMDFYFPDWTIDAYATTCGLCLPRPEVQTVIIKQDQATITWKSVPDATGYEVTCSGGSVTVKGTTATITGLTPLSDYTYSIRATGGEPYTCFRTTSGSFSTPDCDDMPYDITATPYNVTQAIIRWKAEAERGKVIVYTDEACTSVFTTIADTISPCTVTGLAENTRYYFKVFAGATQECASPVQTFLTQTTAVELVEWLDNGVLILLTGDETTATLLVEDKQEKIETTTHVAEKLFISKYFEADGNNKMVAVYNGTPETIDITNYWLKHSNKGSSETKICLKNFGKTPGRIAPNEEIIIMRFTSSTDGAIECAKKEDNYEEWNIISDNATDGEGNNIHNWLTFSGPQSIGLYDGTTMIDVVGARTASGALVQIQSSNKDACSDAVGSDNDGAGFSARGLERNTGDSITLSTNRCLLIRKNTVVSGDNAVATNIYSTQEECSSEIVKAFKTLSDEWVGYVIGKDNASTRTCEGLAEVGGFDYQEYYASFDSVTVVEDLERNEDGTIFIPVDGLDTMSCSLMRINVYNKTTMEQMASREYRIPIMIQEGEVKTTNDLFTKHDAPACKECDVLVFSGATLKKDNTKEDRDEIHDLTIYPGGTLELPAGAGDYTVNTITYRVEGDNAPVTNLNGNLITNAKQMIVTKRIKNDRYYFISLPYNCAMADVSLTNGYRAVNGKDFRLMEYDGEARAKEGSLQGAPGHWKLMTGDTIYAGQGYAIAVNTTAMKEIVFPMTLPDKNITEQERTKQTNKVTIEEYVGQARNTNHNWNLIAHPYITKFDMSATGVTVDAYWENPSRENTGWIDDWQTWDEPTQPTDSTTTQPTDSTWTQPTDSTQTTDYLEQGMLEGELMWKLTPSGELLFEVVNTAVNCSIPDYNDPTASPWAHHRQLIESIKINAEISSIGKYAFAQCTNLKSIYIGSKTYVSATSTTFQGVTTNNISLTVPQSQLSRYQTSSSSSVWYKMQITTYDDSTTSGAPRRTASHPDGWTESPGGIYVTIPIVEGGKVAYEQRWINEVDDIAPFTAVFIQGDGLGQMNFNMYPETPAPARRTSTNRNETKDNTVFVGVDVRSDKGKHDHASLRLRPDFTEKYKFGLDLIKFTTFYTERPQLYFKTTDDQLAFRAVSDSLAENTWIPMGIYCRDAGTYTFSLYDRYVWDEIEAVYLRDNVTGTTTNLLFGNYTIETTKQLYTNTRFSINVLLRRKEHEVPTSIDHTEDPNAPRKFFRDGVMYIMRDGKTYDLTGKPVVMDNVMLNQ